MSVRHDDVTFVITGLKISTVLTVSRVALSAMHAGVEGGWRRSRTSFGWYSTVLKSERDDAVHYLVHTAISYMLFFTSTIDDHKDAGAGFFLLIVILDNPHSSRTTTRKLRCAG